MVYIFHEIQISILNVRNISLIIQNLNQGLLNLMIIFLDKKNRETKYSKNRLIFIQFFFQ